MLMKAGGIGNYVAEHGPITPRGGAQEALDRLREAEEGSVGRGGQDRAPGQGQGVAWRRTGLAGLGSEGCIGVPALWAEARQVQVVVGKGLSCFRFTLLRY